MDKLKGKSKAPNDDGKNRVISDNLKIDNGHLKKSSEPEKHKQGDLGQDKSISKDGKKLAQTANRA